jgi:hypothetical protein
MFGAIVGRMVGGIAEGTKGRIDKELFQRKLEKNSGGILSHPNSKELDLRNKQ